MSDAVPPLDQLVNAFEFEAVAKTKIGPVAFAEIAGGDRRAFDRITFRPRMMVNTTKLDLSLELFGQKLFAPIIVGPVSEQKRFSPDGELAMVRGASAANAAIVVSSQASYSIEQIAAQSKTVLWYQVYPHPEMVSRAQDAVKAGCKAVFLTLGASKDGGIEWSTIDRLRSSIGVPLVLKGILRAEEAKIAVQHGVAGIVVSNYTGHQPSAMAASIEMLPAIADTVGGQASILVDGGFRRGSDVLKALALGARAVLLGRPPVWGLAAYGADGVQRLLELLQTELARDMAMCGRVNLQAIDRTVVKVHSRTD
jgi:isopentenyl diphosphate isomerase/L-lactate dehydrogenase-like FMN-dependent dehydrogenase